MEKRLFFGMQVTAPWPESLPEGRLLDEHHRHMTLAFLGKTDFQKLQEALPTFPQPPFKVGFAAKFDQCLFLPPRHPRVAAWHVAWLGEGNDVVDFQQTLFYWLQEKGFIPDTKHAFTPHVTMARAPFNEQSWKKSFFPLPAIVHSIHLYESVGNLNYASLWNYPLDFPFEELEHTADIAYLVRGKSFNQLFQNAFLALCFHFPPFVSFMQKRTGFDQLDEIIMELNHLVAQADQEIGCPFKAVSFHSTIETKNDLMHWMMIIDV